MRPAAMRVATVATARWQPRSRLFLVGEGADWSIDHDLREVGKIALRLGIQVGPTLLLNASRGQATFYGSQFTLLREPWQPPRHALATAYFHGRPGTPGMPEFDLCYSVLQRRHREIERLQVTHGEMEEIVLSTGIDPGKVHRIPIGVDVGLFPPADKARRAAARAALALPADAFVVGSFQKDGRGFGDGREPKEIKGPDVLLDAFERLHVQVPELHVLLSAPARGYVCAGLERRGIPYRHRVVASYEEVPALFDALDAYVVPSRQEGGPKGVLEAMAAGVPLVTTRVGQAVDIVRHGQNGWIVDVEDGEGLAHWLAHVSGRPSDLAAVIAMGRATAEEHAYERQLPRWERFFAGFVRSAA